MEENVEFKEIEITEGQLGNLHDIAMGLFSSNDPTDYFYRRELFRPRINWLSVVLNWLVPMVLGVALCLVLIWAGASAWLGVAVAIALPLVWLLCNLKRFCICAVKLYQRFAPEAIRRKCRFEPSCSQYMILSLEKYGLRRGLSKGIGRLKRCNIDNGGFDEP